MRNSLTTMGTRLTENVMENLLVELEDFDSELNYYKHCVLDLQQRSSEAGDLVSQKTFFLIREMLMDGLVNRC